MKIAVVHDWLVTYAGAERVLEQILEVYPDADVFIATSNIKTAVMPNAVRIFPSIARIQTLTFSLSTAQDTNLKQLCALAVISSKTSPVPMVMPQHQVSESDEETTLTSRMFTSCQMRVTVVVQTSNH
jgi:hypothetical protein